MHSFAHHGARRSHARRDARRRHRHDRMLSYLPLAHVVERAVRRDAPASRSASRSSSPRASTPSSQDLQRARPTLFVLGAAAVAEVPGGRVREDAAGRSSTRLLQDPDRGAARAEEGAHGPRPRAGAARASRGSAPIAARADRAGTRALGLELLEGYGMTENFGVSHITRPAASARRLRRPAAARRRAAASRDDGEMLVKSPGTMLGYYKEPELTAETLDADGFFHTGDRGRDRRAGPPEHHRPREGALQDQQGQVRRARADRESAAVHARGRGLRRHGRQPRQPFGIVVLNADAAAALERRRRRGPSSRPRCADHLDADQRRSSIRTSSSRSWWSSRRWTVENGFLTPTLKVKRNRIEEAYAPLFERWTASRRAVVWHTA